ncbi:MAG: AmmeMemoRadiSam system protein A, partial [Elusimicrobiota bacterium]
AAFEDRRFQPVAKDELEKVHIEISILTQPVRVKDHGAVVPGKHGVTARQGRNSGLFLPTVWEQLPTKEEFLTRLCAEKAGLPPDCWKDPSVILSVFESEVFEENGT